MEKRKMVCGLCIASGEVEGDIGDDRDKRVGGGV